jgi:ribose/xylose/arabinose/galactoside ABC-type transport system permease subunit
LVAAQASGQTKTNSRMGWSASQIMSRYGITLVLLVLIIALSILSPIIRGEQFFLTPRNLIQVGLQAAINAIIAVGMTFVITSGGIDLSVGSVVALAGVVAAIAMRDWGVGPVGGFLVAVGVGLLCGAFNGLLITRVGLPPFIATLGTMGMFRGAALVISEGLAIYGFGREFSQIFAGTFLGIPTPVIAAFLVALIFYFVLNHMKFGKYTIAIGGNEETSRVAGIPVGKYKMGIYMLSGLLTGVAAALLLARLSSGDPTYGSFFELDAIAAVIMGGTSLAGGEGTIGGTMVGALIISLVQNGMNLFNVPSYWQQIIVGSVIVLAVMLDQWRRKQAAVRML